MCKNYPGLDPIKMLDYPFIDVLDLMIEQILYNRLLDEMQLEEQTKKPKVIYRPADDSWL